MKRAGILAGLLAVLVLGADTAVAGGGGASIHLKAPKSISASKKFSVTASGTAPAKGKQFVIVTLTKKETCAESIAAAQERGDATLSFKGNSLAQVPHGRYSVKSDKLDAGSPGRRTLCGYLYAGSQTSTSAPEAHATRDITFTG